MSSLNKIAILAIVLILNSCTQKDSPRFSFSGDGSLVYDKSTGLTWKRCPEAFKWNGTNCVLLKGEKLDRTFVEIATIYPDINGFRLPTIHELFSLVDHSRTNLEGTVDPLIFPYTTGQMWSNTAYASKRDWSSITAKGGGWLVDFSDGSVHFLADNNPRPIRLVRISPLITKSN